MNSIFRKFRFYISPYFPIRFLMLQHIKYINKKYLIKGSALDVGCGEKPFRKYFKNISKYTGIDFQNFSINKDFSGEKPDVFFSLDYLENYQLPFEDRSFDNIFSFQVLEHHANPSIFIKEIIRVVKQGGFIVISAPFLYPLHETPNDYQRITPYGLKKLLAGCDVEIKDFLKEGSIFVTISMILNETLNNFASRSKFHYFLGVLMYLPLFIYQYLSLLIDRIFKSEIVFCNYLILIKKL